MKTAQDRDQWMRIIVGHRGLWLRDK